MSAPHKFLSLFSVFALLFASITPAASAHVQIDEFMANPAVITDANGEWIEITNTGDEDLSLTDWVLQTGTINDSTPTSDTFPDDTLILAGRFLVICDNDNNTMNGGVVCDLEMTMSLTNTDGKIVLIDNTSVQVDEVNYYSESEEEAKPSDDYENIQEGVSSKVDRNEVGDQTGTTNSTDNTYGPNYEASGTENPAQHGSPAGNNVTNQNNPNHAYATIQQAIDDAEDGDTIVITGDQTLNTRLVVNKNVTLTSPESCEVTIEGLISIEADGATIENLEITNPTNNGAVVVSANNVAVRNNCITAIGTDGLAGSTTAIAIDDGLNNLDMVFITGNTINNVASNSTDATAIEVANVSNLIISNNTIAGIIANNSATAILLDESSDGVHISKNIIDSINSEDEAHGIVLAENNQSTLLEENVITNVKGSKLSVAVLVDDQDATSLTTIQLTMNRFSYVDIGLINSAEAVSQNRINAQMNWWGDISGPLDTVSSDNSLPATNDGAGVEILGAVDYLNWTGLDEKQEEDDSNKAPDPVVSQPLAPVQPPTVTLATFQQPATPQQQTSNQQVAADNDTTPQTSSASDEKTPITEVPSDTSSSWLNQNWFIVLVIVLGGSSIWYFFVRPNEQV